MHAEAVFFLSNDAEIYERLAQNFRDKLRLLKLRFGEWSTTMEPKLIGVLFPLDVKLTSEEEEIEKCLLRTSSTWASIYELFS